MSIVLKWKQLQIKLKIITKRVQKRFVMLNCEKKVGSVKSLFWAELQHVWKMQICEKWFDLNYSRTGFSIIRVIYLASLKYTWQTLEVKQKTIFRLQLFQMSLGRVYNIFLQSFLFEVVIKPNWLLIKMGGTKSCKIYGWCGH